MHSLRLCYCFASLLFSISLVFLSFIYFLILCFRVVCGMLFFAVGITESSDLEPAFARMSAISFPSKSSKFYKKYKNQSL